MRAARTLSLAVAIVCLAAARAGAMPARTKAEIPEHGGVAAAVTVASLATATASTATAAAPSADLAPGSVSAGPAVASTPSDFSDAPGPIGFLPCGRRKFGGQWGDALSFCVDATPPRERGARPAPPSPEAVARLLADRAVALAPDPRIEVAPEHVGLVGLEAYFWVDAASPIRALARAGAVIVEAEARPVQYTWNFGDGTRRVTSHPGVPWRPGHRGSIGHTYERDGVRNLVVEQVWEARWRVAGRAWSRLGYFSTAGGRAYRVRQVVALLVPAL